MKDNGLRWPPPAPAAAAGSGDTFDRALLAIRETMDLSVSRGLPVFVAALKHHQTRGPPSTPRSRSRRARPSRILHPGALHRRRRADSVVQGARAPSLRGWALGVSTVWGELGFDIFLRARTASMPRAPARRRRAGAATGMVVFMKPRRRGADPRRRPGADGVGQRGGRDRGGRSCVTRDRSRGRRGPPSSTRRRATRWLALLTKPMNGTPACASRAWERESLVHRHRLGARDEHEPDAAAAAARTSPRRAGESRRGCR